jgi:hypothetical protein
MEYPMENRETKVETQKEYCAPKIVEKRDLEIELFSGEPPVQPPWPGP